MKFISVLVSCMMIGSSLVFPSAQSEQKIEIVTEDIKSHLITCRQLIQELTHSHSKVLDQFDVFSHTLQQAFSSGEGLIDKDVIRIIEAISFSAEKHRFQTRKDVNQTPYIIHPMGVANNLMTIGHVRDPDIIIGALLHDTVEDTNTNFDEIEQKFGQRVAGFVREVTDDKSLPAPVRKQLQIVHAYDKSAGAAQIKLADKLYNLADLASSPPADWDQERTDAYFRWAKAVVDNLPWVNAPLKQAVDDTIHQHWQKTFFG